MFEASCHIIIGNYPHSKISEANNIFNRPADHKITQCSMYRLDYTHIDSKHVNIEQHLCYNISKLNYLSLHLQASKSLYSIYDCTGNIDIFNTLNNCMLCTLQRCNFQAGLFFAICLFILGSPPLLRD